MWYVFVFVIGYVSYSFDILERALQCGQHSHPCMARGKRWLPFRIVRIYSTSRQSLYFLFNCRPDGICWPWYVYLCSLDTPSEIVSGSSDAEWYLDDVDRPAKRLRRELQTSFPTYNVSLPSDTTCSLSATKNVFARLLNGVAESEVCLEAATADNATGQFIHVEQAYHATLEDAFDGWARALIATFLVSTLIVVSSTALNHSDCQTVRIHMEDVTFLHYSNESQDRPVVKRYYS